MSGGFLISGRTHLHSGGPRPGAERVGRDLQLDADWGFSTICRARRTWVHPSCCPFVDSFRQFWVGSEGIRPDLGGRLDRTAPTAGVAAGVPAAGGEPLDRTPGS